MATTKVFTVKQNEKKKLKEGETHDIGYKIFDNGEEVGGEKGAQALIVVSFHRGKKDGEFTISPHCVGHGDGLLTMLGESATWESEIAKGLGMSEAVMMLKMKSLVGQLGELNEIGAKLSRNKKTSKSSKKKK